MSLGQSWRTFVRALKLSYEHIGKVMLTNLIWFGVGFFPFLAFTYVPFLQNDAVFITTIVATFITLGGATAAVNYRMNCVILGEDTGLRDLWDGFRLYWVRGTILLVLGLLGLVLLVFNIWFSQNYPSTLFLVLSGLWIWGIIYWSALQQFVFPFLTNQNIGVLKTLKRSALIVLDNPLSVFFLLIVSVIIVALSVVLAAPLLIFMASFLALLHNCFYHELMAKYEALERDISQDVEGEGKE
ncbi:MAG: hypothetical protein QM451_12050 [Bacillota bacterium]|jgi:uncharacterized membrane protein YesL|nr:hypothetical protein [Bacillota bacterium]HHT90564.1 hypothetical protein [Bacillota bacterium]